MDCCICVTFSRIKKNEKQTLIFLYTGQKKHFLKKYQYNCVFPHFYTGKFSK